MPKRICIVCGSDFEGGNSSKYCSKACYYVVTRERYNNKKEEKLCKYCGNAFIGKRQEQNCEDCGRKRKLDKTKQFVQTQLCRKCGDVVQEELKFATGSNKSGKQLIVNARSLCFNCYADSIENWKLKSKERMLSEKNPAKLGRKHEIRTKPIMTQAEFSVFMSERMKKNNPMKNPETVTKVSKTLKEYWKTHSKIIGTEHWLWKGNRLRSKTIRSRLYPVWTRPILDRDSYTCQNCGQAKCALEVHHITKTFREILVETLGDRILVNLTENDFEILCEEILEKHKYCDGVTLCVPCHCLLDEMRRSNENKIDKKDQI